MEKIVVTGASGFIGKNLVPKLSGYEVFTPLHKEMDITKPEEINAYFEKIGRVDFLIHLASSIPRGQTDNLSYYTVNTLGTANICEHGLFDKIIFLSSEDIYGESGRFTEDDEPTPKTHYAVSKLLSERFVETTKKYCVLRCSSVYGIGDTKPGRLIPDIMRRAVDGEALEIWGDGLGARDYTYVDDVVNVILRALKKSWRIFTWGVYNIGYGEPITKKDIITEVAKLAGVDVKFNFYEKPTFDASLCMDITNVRKYLGWRPKISWREGLKKTYSWWEECSKKNS